MKLISLAKKVVQILNEESGTFNYSLEKTRKSNDTKKVGVMYKGGKVCPIVYLDSIPGIDTLSVADVAETVKKILCRNYQDTVLPFECLEDFKRENIFFQLLNKDKNTKYLADVPTMPLLDLVFVPRYFVGKEEGYLGSVLLNKKILHELNVDVERDFEEIKENTLRLFGMKVTNLVKALTGLTEQDVDCSTVPDNCSDFIYVISNTANVYGAAAVLLSEAYRDLSPSGFLIPSSVHEFLAIPLFDGGTYNVSELNAIVKEVNTACVSVDEVLSDSVYYWSDGKGIEIACTKQNEDGQSQSG